MKLYFDASILIYPAHPMHQTVYLLYIDSYRCISTAEHEMQHENLIIPPMLLLHQIHIYQPDVPRIA